MPGDRHQVERHADVDEHVHEPARQQAECDQAAEASRWPAPRCESRAGRGSGRAPARAATPRKPSSSPTHREDEVGVLLRKERESLLRSLREPLPEPSAGADRDLRLNDVVARRRGSIDGSRKTSSRFCWYGFSLSQRIGARTPITTFADIRKTPSHDVRLVPEDEREEQAGTTPPQNVVLTDRMSDDDRARDEHQEPPRTRPTRRASRRRSRRTRCRVPRSGCAMMSSQGTPTMSAGFHRSSRDLGASLRRQQLRRA